MCSDADTNDEHSNEVDRTLMLARLPIGFVLAASTIATPDSYDLALSLGAGPAFSGSIAGTTSTGFFVGTTCMWLIGRSWPYFWQAIPLLVQTIGLLLMMLSALTFMMVCAAAGTAATAPIPTGNANSSLAEATSSYETLGVPNIFGLSIGSLRLVVLFAQLLQGMSSAAFVTISFQLIANLPAPAKRPHYSSLQTEVAMLGLGSGPVLAGVAHMSYGLIWGGPRHFASMAMARIVLALCAGVCLLLCRFPDLSKLGAEAQTQIDVVTIDDGKSSSDAVVAQSEDFDEIAQSTFAKQHQLPSRGVQLRICGAVLVAALLHFMASGLEVASVMILEIEFGWNASHAGFIVGVTFLCGLPLRRLLNIAKATDDGERRTVSLIRLLLVINAISCILLLRQLCLALALATRGDIVCIGLLLFADLLFYSSIMFAQANLRGIALQHAQTPGEGPFDATNIVMGWAIAVDLIARTVGAPLARARLASNAGRDGYALQQLAVLLIAWMCAEILVFPSLDGQSDSKCRFSFCRCWGSPKRYDFLPAEQVFTDNAGIAVPSTVVGKELGCEL